MKKLILLLLLVPLSFKAIGQNIGKPTAISFGYYSQFALQPGFKVGTDFIFPASDYNVNKWLLSTQIGFFTNIGDDNNLVLNVEVGKRKTSSSKHVYHTFALGIGYRYQAKLNSFSTSLGSGKSSDKERIYKGYFLPTLSYEFGWNTHKKVAWFSKYAVGPTLSTQVESSLAMFLEVGMKISLISKNPGNE
ncbi:hypothetical protein [Roseivirga sp. E12]|uniref:hypothetical protein n=1 Tax=Roseivirga sp. E12 TaxID=2819237 RepID=UPI001ABC08B9|nr:hypothetical protein [Roseivirga sp. E12]MBO3698099.1 hypothetical protein [Roseivirga sp. E12]